MCPHNQLAFARGTRRCFLNLSLHHEEHQDVTSHHFLHGQQTGQEFFNNLGTLPGEEPKEFLVPQKNQRLRQAIMEVNEDKLLCE